MPRTVTISKLNRGSISTETNEEELIVQNPALSKHHHKFSEAHTLHQLKHYLPSQTPLKDFIHHNSLHAYQQEKFYDAIFTASKIFGYSVTLQLSEFRELYKTGRIREEIVVQAIERRKGTEQVDEWKEKMLKGEYSTINTPKIGELRANWKRIYKFDLDVEVQPLLFRILCSYLDQGISLWKFPLAEEGFLASVRELEKNSFTSFFRTHTARDMLLQGNCSISHLLDLIVGKEAYYEQYLFDQQFCHHGWSGIVAAIELQPHSLLDSRRITLHDVIVFELLLELDTLDDRFGKKWKPLGSTATTAPADLFSAVPSTETNEVIRLWQDAFEWSYYDDVLAAMQENKLRPQVVAYSKNFQALFCIDERECSLRRHFEQTSPDCETFGTPGFFTTEFYFQPENGRFYEKLCPAPVSPKYLIKETAVTEKREREILYARYTHTFLKGTLATLVLGLSAAVKMLQNLFRPAMSPAISNAFSHMGMDSKLTIENTDPADRENDLQIGFTVEEMAARVEGQLRGIGLIKEFAPLVYAIAHGSSSANNPHHGAHDCGACSGRPGAVNARVFAFMANHPGVRKILYDKGIHIPDATQFVAAMHDTAADRIGFYDVTKLPAENFRKHQDNVIAIENALDLNAKERSRRFASIKTKASLKKVRKAIRERSVSLFEPRPELGHGTNTLCIVGRRSITKGMFLDRRAFLNSYDYKTDPEGKLLTGIMKPLGPVCGGINLEYYFSRVDNHKFGAGTKLPHNVMGLIGVANSSDGDLRPGLPLQMIEVHDPVRLLTIVEHFPEVVLKTIQSVPEMYEWFINEWVHLVAVNPDTGEFFYFKEGAFMKYTPAQKKTIHISDLNALIESAPEMATNNIVDATKENLPVYLINN